MRADAPLSLRCRAPFHPETALPEANSFLCAWPTVRQHWGECEGDLRGRCAEIGWAGRVKELIDGLFVWRASLTRRRWVSTLEQSPERWRSSCDPGKPHGDRAGYPRDGGLRRLTEDFYGSSFPVDRALRRERLDCDMK